MGFREELSKIVASLKEDNPDTISLLRKYILICKENDLEVDSFLNDEYYGYQGQELPDYFPEERQFSYLDLIYHDRINPKPGRLIHDTLGKHHSILEKGKEYTFNLKLPITDFNLGGKSFLNLNVTDETIHNYYDIRQWAETNSQLHETLSFGIRPHTILLQIREQWINNLFKRINEKMILNIRKHTETQRTITNDTKPIVSLGDRIPNFTFHDENLIEEPFVFVLMPFDEIYNDLYETVIKKTIDDMKIGLSVKKADMVLIPGKNVMDKIFNLILQAKFIVADITGLNPNVMYELGISDVLGKEIIMLFDENKGSKPPFDVQSREILFYNTSTKSGYENLSKLLSKSIEAINSRKNSGNLRLETLNNAEVDIVDVYIDDYYRINDTKTVTRPAEEYLEFEGTISIIVKFYNPFDIRTDFFLEYSKLITSKQRFEFAGIGGGRKEFPISPGYMNKRINFKVPKDISVKKFIQLEIKGYYFSQSKKVHFHIIEDNIPWRLKK